MQTRSARLSALQAVVRPTWQAKIETAALLAAGMTLLQRALLANQPGILMDDAFISFRYAANLARGLGLVYNPGERVEGYTNFLWTVLLALCARLGFDIAAATKVILALAAFATLALIFVLARRIFAGRPAQPLLVSAPVLLFAVQTFQARYIVSGMETHLFVFLLLLAVALFLYGSHPFLTGLVFALAAMTRPEGVLYFVIAIGYAVLLWLLSRPAAQRIPGLRAVVRVTRRSDKANGSNLYHRYPSSLRSLVLLAAGFLLLYGAYFLWRYQYYGFLAPNTYYAKAAGFHLERLARGWQVLRQAVPQAALLPLLVLAPAALLSLRRSRLWLLLAVYVAATLAYFLYVGGDFIVWFGPRFLMPVIPFLLLMSMEGLDRLLGLALPGGWAKFSLQSVLVAILVAYTLVFSWPWSLRMESFTTQMRGWAELGRWIGASTPPQAAIATDAAGLIPFYSGRYAIDMFGLTDRHIAHLSLPASAEGIVAHEKFDPRYVLDRNPECIVSTWMDAQGQALSSGLALVQERFNQRYHLVAVAKVQQGPPADGRWVIPTTAYSQFLFDAGYISGLFCRIDLPAS